MELQQQKTNTRTGTTSSITIRLKKSVNTCHKNSNSEKNNDNFVCSNEEEEQQQQHQQQEPYDIGLSTPIRNSYRNRSTTHNKVLNNNNDNNNNNNKINTEVSNGTKIMTSTSIFDLLYGKRHQQTTTTATATSKTNKLFPKGKHGQPLCFDVIVIGGSSSDDGNGNNDKNYNTNDSPHSPISELTGISYLVPSPVLSPKRKASKRNNGTKDTATETVTDVIPNDNYDQYDITVDNTCRHVVEHDNYNPSSSCKNTSKNKICTNNNNNNPSNDETKTSTTRFAAYYWNKVVSCSTNDNDNNDHDRNVRFSCFLSCILKDLLDDFYKCFQSPNKHYFKNDWYCTTTCCHHMSNQDTYTKLYQITYSTIITSLVQLLYTMAFGIVLHIFTNGMISMLDTMLSTSISGIIYSIVSGQPLILHNVNIPIILFISSFLHTLPLNDDTATTTNTSESYNKTLYFWMIVSSSILHILAACIGIVRKLSHYITPFICQTYELLISLSIIIIILREIIRPIHILENYNTSSSVNNSNEQIMSVQQQYQRSVGYASACLLFLTVVLIMTIQYIVHDKFYLCTQRIRKNVSLYNIPIVCVIVTIVSYIPGIDQRLSTAVTSSMNSTNIIDNADHSTLIGILRVEYFFQQEASPPLSSSHFINVVNPLNINTNEIYQLVIALMFGCLLFVLSIVHETVCFSKIVQTTTVNTKSTTTTKKALTVTTNTWDIFIIGCTSFIVAIFGLPICQTSNETSLVHIQSLTFRSCSTDAVTNYKTTIDQQPHQLQNIKEERMDTPINGVDSTTASTIIINEQRWSGLIQSLLLLLIVAISSVLFWEVPILNRIPVAFLYGMLLYVGISSFQCNDIVHRMVLYCCMTQENRQKKEQQQQVENQSLFEKANVMNSNISWVHVQIYTLVQVSFVIGLAIVATCTNMGYLFPTGLLLLFIFRWYFLKQQFSPDTVTYLDSSNQYLCIMDINATSIVQQQLPITVRDLQQNSTENDDTGDNNDENTENQIDLPTFLDAIEDEDETTFHTPRFNKQNNTSLSLLVPDLSFSLSPTQSCHSPMRTEATAQQQQQRQMQMQKKETTKSESMLVGVYNSNVTNTIDENSICDSESALFNLELLSS